MSLITPHKNYYERRIRTESADYLGWSQLMSLVLHGNARLCGDDIHPNLVEYPNLIRLAQHDQEFQGYQKSNFEYETSFEKWVEFQRTQRALRFCCLTYFDEAKWQPMKSTIAPPGDLGVVFPNEVKWYRYSSQATAIEASQYQLKYVRSISMHRFTQTEITPIPLSSEPSKAESVLRQAAMEFVKYFEDRVPISDRDFMWSRSRASRVVEILSMEDERLLQQLNSMEDTHLTNEMANISTATSGYEKLTTNLRLDFYRNSITQLMFRMHFPLSWVRLYWAAELVHPYRPQIIFEDVEIPSFATDPTYRQLGAAYDAAGVQAINCLSSANLSRNLGSPPPIPSLDIDSELEVMAALDFYSEIGKISSFVDLLENILKRQPSARKKIHQIKKQFNLLR